DDYYDIDIVQLSAFNYQLTSTGYREIAGQETASSSFTAQLRLNPCIVYWQAKKENISISVTIGGDAYFGDAVINYGNIYGDAYSAKTITNALFGQIQGQVEQNQTQAPINPPGIVPADFSSVYYIGSDVYSVGQLVPGDYYTALTLSPNGSNPAGVYYCNGNITFLNTVNINGTLVVKDDLSIKGSGNVTIQAVKNFPALIVGGKLHLDAANVKLAATGYTQVGDHIDMHNRLNSSITVNGALYVLDDGIKNTLTAYLTVTGMPQKAALAIWSSGGNLTRWSPAAGAFYKTIARNP
ncbi:MAG: hypothetical protein PHQ00_01950, partial [Phycisphaerae bacterium]|nr:hypothetical protein [Phycisphaerae bacterium]